MEKKEWVKQEGPPMWLPESDGDTIEGTIVGVTEGMFGRQFEIKLEDGSKIRTPSHKVLQNRMSGAEQGCEVRIIYQGEDPPAVKGQNPTKMYDVYLKIEDPR